MQAVNRQQARWMLWLKVCIVLQLLLLVMSLPGQRVHGDEAAFAEIAYWQASEGHPRSELFRGLLGYEDRILLCHKLWEALGALVILLFGFGLWPLRVLSLLATAGIMYLLWGHFCGGTGRAAHGSGPDRLGFLIAVAFLLLAPLTFKFAKFYRPEMMQAALGLGSFIALRHTLHRRASRLALLAGALAGVATLVHLNGVVYAVAGFGLLVARCRWREASLFTLAAAAVCALFFYDIVGNPQLFWWQWVADPTFGESERTIAGTIIKLFEEHKRLFRKPEIIFSSALFFAAYFTSIGYQRRQQGNFLLYVVFLIIALGALAPAKTTPYAILLFPFFAVGIGRTGGAVIRGDLAVPRWLRTALALCTVAFIGHSIAAAAINAFTDKHNWVEDNRRIAESLPAGAKVLAPLDFVFNDVDRFQIAGLRLARWRLGVWSSLPYDFERLVYYADSAVIHAIILNREERRQLESYPAVIGETTGPYRLVKKLGEGGLWLWQREADEGS